MCHRLNHMPTFIGNDKKETKGFKKKVKPLCRRRWRNLKNTVVKGYNDHTQNAAAG